MKYTQRKQTIITKKRLLVGVIIIALLLGGSVLAYKKFHKQESKGPTAAQKREEEKQADKTKQQTADRTNDKDGTTTPPSTDITAFINRASQVSSNGAVTISVRATIQGTDSGTCQLTFSKPGQSDIIKTFAIQQDATSATCGNADVPTSEFPVSGEWQLSLVAKNSNKQSSPVTSKVTVQK